MKQYIGHKRVKSHKKTDEKTVGGTPLIRIEYVNGDVEVMSKLVFDVSIGDKAITATELAEKRILPVVEETLKLMREWGLKISELPYFSAKLNQSLDYSTQQAVTWLLKDWMPRPNSMDDVDLVTLDRILKDIKPSLKDIQTGDDPAA